VRLLVTRPEPDAERTAATLRARGCEVIVAALLRVETLAPELGHGPWRALALTSANAARAIERHPRRAELVTLPAFVVGRRTGAAARAAGFGEVRSADGNASDLVRLIAARVAGGALLYLAGEDRAGDLVGDLAAHGVTVETAVVYRAAKVSSFPAAAAAALAAGGLDGVLHYSRRSTEAYLDCARAAGLLDQALAPVHYCLAQPVAEPLLKAGARDMRIAARPEEGALLDLIAIT
jgi:uroporphyrinogen-III synthase